MFKLHQLTQVLHHQIRTLYKKPKRLPTFWTKKEVDSYVLQVLFDYAKVPDEKVNLYANLSRDLLTDGTDRYSLYLDLTDAFQLRFPSDTNDSRNWESGREFADWVAANLEEQNRLADYE